ncbi:MAG: hypothetical protein IOD15_00270 [Phycisphaerales bacterium]|nr:hypothetical protein [Phycisphaerales bacterium]
MSEPIHADSNTEFDPQANYLPCCHPQYFPIGTRARDTYEEWAAGQQARLDEWRAEQAAQNTQQEPR